MEYIYSIILGIVQGLTEFWPISSSGHLVVAHEMLDFDFVNNLGFDVALHLGTLFALVVFFRREISAYIVALFSSFANWNLAHDMQQRLAWYIALGSVPAFIVGYLVMDYAETVFRNLWLVAGLLIGVGLLFFVIERVARQAHGLERLSWKSALLIGLAQAAALLPGVSRSGITIITGMGLGLRRVHAARFSFLLSIPVVFGAGMKKMYDLTAVGISGAEWVVMAVGLATAAVVGYFAIKFLLRFLEHRPLNAFGWYRIALGIIIIAFIVL